MRRLFISLITLGLSAAAQATVINNTAGALQGNTASKDITSLTVTGTIDARDFKFIADSLTQLTELDLSQAQIVAYNSTKPLAGNVCSFPADELPSLVLMESDINTIVLPQGLKSLGHASLAGCANLTAVVLPETVTTIGSFALSATGITSISIPQSVAQLGEGAFAHCDSLTTVSFNAQQVPDFAFMGNTALAHLTLGNNVTVIGKDAFNGCTALSTITVDADNAIKEINAEAFIGAGAQAIDLSALAQLESIGDWAFASSSITSASIPQNATLGKGAFFYASNLGTVLLPQDIASIPDFAFAGAESLNATFDVPEQALSLGDYAFYNASNISVFNLPSSVEYLGNWAMAGMTGLDTINAARTTVPALGDSVWAGVMQNAVMLSTADNDVADLYAAVEQWKEFHILRNYYMGDVNMDGTVDITDVNALVAYVMNMEVSPFNIDVADINNDGSIDITDINGIVSFVLNGNYPYIRKAPGKHHASNGNTTADCISMHDLDINAGETATVELELTNSRQYSALQFDIDMPEGLVIVPGSLRGTTRDSKHTILLNNDGNRIVAFSSSVSPINGNEGAIITMQVRANDAVQGTIGITGLVLATPKSERYEGTDTYATVSATTGVDDVKACNDKVYAYGNILVIEAQEAGEAQIVAMNGMTQDIHVEAGRTEVDMPTGYYVVRLNGASHKVAIK
ncbi:MAG: leucine-rich repeat protein [Muribaculaceae bacterium]|nr:leucine-rich repeat protein [Muribaculaceae bacterium]